MCCSVLQCIAVYCSILCVAACASVSDSMIVGSKSVCGSVLQRVAVCCSVLQRVSVCCSMLQCVLQCVYLSQVQ